MAIGLMAARINGSPFFLGLLDPLMVRDGQHNSRQFARQI